MHITAYRSLKQQQKENLTMDTKHKVENWVSTEIVGLIPGVEFRGFIGESDYSNILAIIDGSKQVDGIERSDTLEEITHYYKHLHHCDPARDMLFAEADGQAVGYCRSWWDINEDGEFKGFSLAYLLPEWRRKGIGRTFLHFCEGRLLDISTELIETGQLAPDAHRSSNAYTSEVEAGKEALLLQEGYTAERYSFSMVRPNLEDIPDLPLPDGLEVRSVLPEHRRAIWDASQEAFRDHWGFIEEPESEYQRMLDDPNVDPSIWQVAWDGDQVAGMVQNYIIKEENAEYNRKRGYTENISVRRPWRRRGLARALIARSLKLLKELGMEEAALGVDAENLSGALNLYTSMGYEVVKRYTSYTKLLS
jgi:mycothiol synthase